MTKKNRKIRLLREHYPDVKCKIFYQRDYIDLLIKYGLERPSQSIPQQGGGESERDAARQRRDHLDGDDFLQSAAEAGGA
ncbi:MAG: hypothetical protein M3164_03635 [Actinomycetota bacterium]|nr:hypothetical protein [Actinomycetota bacterium]